jgi:hypothetical protein
MLKQAALEGARRSQFECRGCNNRYRRIPLDSHSSFETTATLQCLVAFAKSDAVPGPHHDFGSKGVTLRSRL